MDGPIDHGFSPPTVDDHRAWLWTAALLSCIYSFLALSARVTSKWDMLWYDDAILGAGYVFAAAHYGVLFYAIRIGLGAANDGLLPSDVDTTAVSYFSARLLLLVALCLSKVSVLSFSRRIFNGDLHAEKIIFSVALALTVAWFILAILLSSAGCTPKNILIAQENALCSANEARWAVITALDVITEIMLLAIPVWLVSKNQIKTSKKRVVAFVFAFRLVVAGFAIAAAVSYFNFLRGDRDNIGLSATVAWQEVLLGVSLISASIPSLRSFLWAFMSRSMLTMYGIDSKVSQSGSIPMRSVNKSARSMNRSTARSAARSMNRSTHSYGANADGSQNLPDDDEAQEHKNASRLRPDWMQYSVDIGRGKPRGGGAKPVKETGSQSDDSEQMIIHRNVEFEVN